jgi:hypothetical protein
VEVGLSQNINSINENGDEFQLISGINYTIGAGAQLGAKDKIFDNSKYDKFLYLGHLNVEQ